MIRQLKLLAFILIFFSTVYGQTGMKVKEKSIQNVYTVDTSLIAILPFNTAQDWVFKDSKPTDLTNDDLLKIEIILNKCINDYNPSQEKQFKEINDKHPEYKLSKKNFIIDLTRYKRQYIAVLNSKGEKEIWINCFCDTMNKKWKENLVFVLDGGNCYFNLKINLTTGLYFDLMVNGYA